MADASVSSQESGKVGRAARRANRSTRKSSSSRANLSGRSNTTNLQTLPPPETLPRESTTRKRAKIPRMMVMPPKANKRSQATAPISSDTDDTERTTAREVVVLDDTLPDLSSDEEIDVDTPDNTIVDLTSEDDAPRSGERQPVASTTIDLTTPAPRRRTRVRGMTPNADDDDMPLVAVRTTPRTADSDDVIVIEKENRTASAMSAPPDEYNHPADTLTPKRKLLSCPICLDHERSIRRTGRQMMSTTCGHIFCNECILKSIESMKCCPSCRKKLTKKTGFHPIFI